jgi:pyridoxine kinase
VLHRAACVCVFQLAACEALHALGPETVIITSMDVEGDDGFLSLIGSTRAAQAPGCPPRFRLRLPKRPGYFTGAGDLTAALLLARAAGAPDRLAHAAERAVASVQAVLARTAAAAAAPGAPPLPAGAELRLVQSAAELREPSVAHRAEALP